MHTEVSGWMEGERGMSSTETGQGRGTYKIWRETSNARRVEVPLCPRRSVLRPLRISPTKSKRSAHCLLHPFPFLSLTHCSIVASNPLLKDATIARHPTILPRPMGKTRGMAKTPDVLASLLPSERFPWIRHCGSRVHSICRL